MLESIEVVRVLHRDGSEKLIGTDPTVKLELQAEKVHPALAQHRRTRPHLRNDPPRIYRRTSNVWLWIGLVSLFVVLACVHFGART